MKLTWLALSTTLATAALVLTPRPNLAQVIPDGSLGTAVNGNPNFQITGGTTAGRNLFHSFQQFSVPLGGSAVFLNSPGIDNIFSRVTGGNVSAIDGLIAAQGRANLFLINPAGITLGSRASLRLGGSFFATTADRIVFSNGVILEAIDPTEPPLLTTSSPIGLDFSRNNSASIRVEGESYGSTLRTIRTTPVDSPAANPGLEVTSINTLDLSGGETNLIRGNINPGDTDLELEADVLDPNEEVVLGCHEFAPSRLVETGRGGVPEDPRNRRSASSTWHDVRDPSAYLGTTAPAPRRVEALSLIEANATRQLPDGSLELYYAGPPTLHRLPHFDPSNC